MHTSSPARPAWPPARFGTPSGPLHSARGSQCTRSTHALKTDRPDQLRQGAAGAVGGGRAQGAGRGAASEGGERPAYPVRALLGPCSARVRPGPGPHEWGHVAGRFLFSLGQPGPTLPECGAAKAQPRRSARVTGCVSARGRAVPPAPSGSALRGDPDVLDQDHRDQAPAGSGGRRRVGVAAALLRVTPVYCTDYAACWNLPQETFTSKGTALLERPSRGMTHQTGRGAGQGGQGGVPGYRGVQRASGLAGQAADPGGPWRTRSSKSMAAVTQACSSNGVGRDSPSYR